MATDMSPGILLTAEVPHVSAAKHCVSMLPPDAPDRGLSPFSSQGVCSTSLNMSDNWAQVDPPGTNSQHASPYCMTDSQSSPPVRQVWALQREVGAPYAPSPTQLLPQGLTSFLLLTIQP